MKRAAVLIVAMIALVMVAGEPSAVSSPATDAVSTSAKAQAPSERQWKRDVAKVMEGGPAYLKARVADAAPGARLAVNFDIDNTMMASYYDRGGHNGEVFRFAKKARELGIAVLVNSGRYKQNKRSAKRYLAEGGYTGSAAFDDMCLRAKSDETVVGKQKCRARYRADGYTLIANVGNNPTDFAGDTYGEQYKAYRLPNYNGTLN